MCKYVANTENNYVIPVNLLSKSTGREQASKNNIQPLAKK